MSSHAPNRLEVARLEVLAAFGRKLNAHIAIAQAWKRGTPDEATCLAYSQSLGELASAERRLRAAIAQEVP